MKSLITSARIEKQIHIVRGNSVMLDSDLAKLYGVPTKVLVQAVTRNIRRFPSDFMFQLSFQEDNFLRSQIVTSNRKQGGRRYHPYVFTEQGVAMLSSVLHSPRAIQVNIEIMRAFVRLKGFQFSYAALRKEIHDLKRKYDASFASVFDKISRLMDGPARKVDVKGFTEETSN